MTAPTEVVERAVADLIDWHRADRLHLDGNVLALVRLVEPDFHPGGTA